MQVSCHTSFTDVRSRHPQLLANDTTTIEHFAEIIAIPNLL